MGQWVVTVAGIAILSVLCDVILPDGDTRKYVKTVVGIVVTLVMLQPIVNFIANPNAQDFIPSSKNDVVIQQPYLDMVKDKQDKRQIKTIGDMLSARGIEVTDIKLDKSQKTVSLNVNGYYSDKISSTVNSVVKIYFDNYKISIIWKEK